MGAFLDSGTFKYIPFQVKTSIVNRVKTPCTARALYVHEYF